MQDSENVADQKYVLAIDVGSTWTKIGLVNKGGNLVACVRGRCETLFLPAGGAEQVPADWWRLITNGVKQVIKESGVHPEAIVAIGVTSQWSVTVAVDEQGEPLMNAISWMDERGGKYNIKIMKGFPSLQGYQVWKLLKWTNIASFPPLFEGTDCIAHMLYIKNEHPDIYRKTYKFLEPMDFINFRLTGKACATQNSNIACLMIDDRRNRIHDYHPWLLAMSGIERAKLPDLLPVEGIVGKLQGHVAREWGLSSETVVITSANDNSVALIGSGALVDYEAVAVLGTSGMLVCHVPEKKVDLIHNNITMPAALKDRYIYTADTGNTGRVVDSVLYKLMFGRDDFSNGDIPEDVYRRLNHAAGNIPIGSEGVVFLPWFNTGALAPTADRYLRGGFINISNSTTRNHLARAMLEGIAYNWRWLKESAEAFTKRKFPYWRLSGGGADSDVWAQIMADVIGIPMHQQENPSWNTVLGIAFLAFSRLGMLSMEETPQKVKFKQIYEPNPANKDIYDRMYSKFRKCTKQLKPVFHSLNKLPDT